MKAMKFTKQVFGLLFISSILFACSKEDGQDGAIGPAGQEGEQGVAGVNGEDGIDGIDGQDGETGTANVIYSDWLDSPITSNNILSSQANGSITVASLSQEIVDSGAVLVYAKGGTNPSVFPLPIVGTDGVSYYYRYDVEDINVRLFKLDGSNIISPSFDTYRYVLIPGGVPASNGIGGIGSKTSAMNYSKMTYEEVTAHFGIED